MIRILLFLNGKYVRAFSYLHYFKNIIPFRFVYIFKIRCNFATIFISFKIFSDIIYPRKYNETAIMLQYTAY